MNIHRYDINLCPDRQCDCGASFATEECPDSNGDYVRYADHARELAALREELAKAKSACSKEFESVQTLDNENTVLKAELSALREELAIVAGNREVWKETSKKIYLRKLSAEQRLADAERRNAELEKDAARWDFFSSVANELQAFPHAWGKMTPEKMNHMCDEAMSAALTKPEEAKS